MDKVNLSEKMKLINNCWSPKILGELNDSYVKAVKLKGEFIWHRHETEDEMFFVVNGRLMIKFREKDVILNNGEFIIIPRGTEHMPVAEEEVQVLLIEAKTTLNTGDVKNDRTIDSLEWI